MNLCFAGFFLHLVVLQLCIPLVAHVDLLRVGLSVQLGIDMYSIIH